MSNRDHGMLVGGERRSAVAWWEVPNRHTGEVFARFPVATAGDVDGALTSAYESRGACAAMPVYERARVLREVADGVARRREAFGRVVAMEAGKPIRDCLGEVDRCVQTLRLSVGESERLGAEVMRLDHGSGQEGTTAELRRVPRGVVGMITPFNFPLNLVAHKVGPAVAAGCPFVLKVADKTPISGLMLCELLLEAGWVSGGVSVVCPRVEDVGPIAEDGRVAMVSFTGSDVVGWGIAERVGGRKPVALELGGDAAVVIDEALTDADLAYAADRITFGAFYSGGQSCISVQRVLVHASKIDAFRSMLVERVSGLKRGAWDDPETFVGPVVDTAAADRIESWIEEARAAGATVLIGGEREGNVIAPCLLEGVPTDGSVSLGCREIFGPVAVLSSFDSFGEALERVNASEFGLQAGVFSRDTEHLEHAASVLEVGGLVVNDIPSFRVDAMPYGGVKRSGVGREGPRFAVEEMTELRTIVRRPLPGGAA